MHNAKDTRENEGTLCPLSFSEAHITQDPESPQAWTLPLLLAVGNDVSPLAMNAFERSDMSGETQLEERVRKRCLICLLRC